MEGNAEVTGEAAVEAEVAVGAPRNHWLRVGLEQTQVAAPQE